jgi:F-type H+-transporting ATPase subunit epsilon
VSEALHLKVVTPTRVVVDAQVDAVTVPGALGALGILPEHAPLLASLAIGVLEYRTGQSLHRLVILKGFAEVAGNVVTVLADHAEKPEEIDLEAARKSRQEGEDALRVVADEAQVAAREAIEAATARIAVAAAR